MKSENGKSMPLKRKLYERKITNSSKQIILKKAEIEVIACEDEEGFEESKSLFSCIGIQWKNNMAPKFDESEDEYVPLTKEELAIEAKNWGWITFGQWYVDNDYRLKRYIVPTDLSFVDDGRDTLIIESLKGKIIGILTLCPSGDDWVTIEYANPNLVITFDSGMKVIRMSYMEDCYYQEEVLPYIRKVQGHSSPVIRKTARRIMRRRK